MSRRATGIVVVAGGAVLVLISALSDVIGLGNPAAFGLRQITGVVVGLAAMIIGGLALRGTRR